MNMSQALQYADQLMTGLSHPYEIDYRDSDGDIHTVTYTPAAELSECGLDGWPDDVEAQDAIIGALKIAIAEDDTDRHLVLSPEQLESVAGLRHATRSTQTLTRDELAERIEALVNGASGATTSLDELSDEWQAEDDAEDDADDLAERKRAVIRDALALSSRSIARCAERLGAVHQHALPIRCRWNHGP